MKLNENISKIITYIFRKRIERRKEESHLKTLQEYFPE